MLQIHAFVKTENSEKYHQKALGLDTISIPYLATTQVLSILDLAHVMVCEKTLRKSSMP